MPFYAIRTSTGYLDATPYGKRTFTPRLISKDTLDNTMLAFGTHHDIINAAIEEYEMTKSSKASDWTPEKKPEQKPVHAPVCDGCHLVTDQTKEYVSRKDAMLYHLCISCHDKVTVRDEKEKKANVSAPSTPIDNLSIG